MSAFFQDLQHTFRLMGRAPGFTFAALATLALAIGANTSVFSVVYGVLLRPLPYPGAERIVILSEEHPGGTALVRDARLSNLTFHAWRGRAQTIESIAGYSSQTVTITSGNEPERLSASSLSPSVFAILGVSPALGRFFREEEASEGANAVVVLSDRFWKSKFGGDPNVVGRTLQIGGRPHDVIGVAPGWFYFPDRDAQLWTPYPLPANSDAGVRLMPALARLKPGVTVEQAAAEGTAAARSVTRPMAADLLFGKGAPVEVRVRTLADQITRRFKPALLVLMAAVGLVLLVACANVANLLRARGTSRARELAVRAALGAGGGRLARQLLTESAAIAILGGALGLLLAFVLTKAVPAWAPEGFPRLDDVRLDARVLTFAFLLSLISGVIAGVLPALRASRSALSPALRVGDGRSSGGGERIRSVLLALEAAMSVMLLIGAALLVRSFIALVSIDPGYSTENVLTARVYLTGTAATNERRVQIVQAMTTRLQSAPGVSAAGAGNMAPLGESSFVSGFSFGRNSSGEPVVARALQYVVTPGYVEALRIRLKEGRLLQPSDETSPIQAILVNEAFARAYITDGKPVTGRRYRGLLAAENITSEIVGVVGNVLKDGLDTQTQPEIYLSHSAQQRITREINLVIRTDGDPSSFVPALRSIVRDVEPTAALGRVGTLASRVADSVSEPRFATAVLAVFAVLALGIASAGLYGVLSYNVSQRKREIGIRAALGATRRNLLLLVVRQGLLVTSVGLAAGMLASALLSRRLQPLLFGIQPLDPASFALMPFVLLIVAAAACAVPARRAAATDPATTLRSE
jgi:putative ABC transport system permease protein